MASAWRFQPRRSGPRFDPHRALIVSPDTAPGRRCRPRRHEVPDSECSGLQPAGPSRTFIGQPRQQARGQRQEPGGIGEIGIEEAERATAIEEAHVGMADAILYPNVAEMDPEKSRGYLSTLLIRRDTLEKKRHLGAQ